MKIKNEFPPENAPDSSLCEQTRFALFEKKELSESQQEHFSHCAFCRSYASETEWMLKALSELDQKPLMCQGKGLADSVMDEISTQSSLFGKSSARKSIFRHAGLVAACVVIAVMAGPTVYQMLNADKNSDANMALYARDVSDMEIGEEESDSTELHKDTRFSYDPSYSPYDHVEPDEEASDTTSSTTSYANTYSAASPASSDEANEDNDAHDKLLIFDATLLADDNVDASTEEEAPQTSKKPETPTTKKDHTTTDSGKNTVKDGNRHDKADNDSKKSDSKTSKQETTEENSAAKENAAPAPTEAARNTDEIGYSATGAEESQAQTSPSATPSENALSEVSSNEEAPALNAEPAGDASGGGSSGHTPSPSIGGGGGSGSSSSAVSADQTDSFVSEEVTSDQASADGVDTTEQAHKASGGAAANKSSLLSDAENAPSSTDKAVNSTNGSLTDTAYAAASSLFSGIYAVDAASAHSQLFDTTACDSFSTSDPSVMIQVFLEQDTTSSAWTISYDSKGNAQIFEVHAAGAE